MVSYLSHVGHLSRVGKFKAARRVQVFKLLSLVFLAFTASTTGGFSPTSWFQTQALADPPTLTLSVSSSTANQARLGWERSAHASNAYTKVQYKQKKTSGGTYSEWQDIPNSGSGERFPLASYSVSGLDRAIYFFKVRTVSDSENGAESNEVEVQVLNRPVAPTNLTQLGIVAPTEDGTHPRAWKVSLQWTLTDDGGGDNVQYEYAVTEANGATFGIWNIIGSPTTTPIPGGGGNTISFDQFEVREVAGTYKLKIRAKSDMGEGPDKEISVVISPVVPYRVSDLSVDTHQGPVQLTWRAPSFNGGSAITRHEYRYKLTSGSYPDPEVWTPIPNSGENEDNYHGYTIPWIAAGNYDIEVRAVNSAGGGEAGSATNFEVFSVPGAPTLGTPTYSYNGDSNQWEIVLSWSAANGNGHTINGYEYKQKFADGSYPDYWDSIPNSGASGENASSFTLPVYEGLGTYSFKLRAQNDEVRSGLESAEKSVTMSAIAPLALTGLFVEEDPNTSGGVQLTWTPPSFNGGSAITRYEYRYKLTSGSYPDPEVWTPIPNSDENGENYNGYAFTGLSAGTYDFEVRAVNSAGVGEAGSATSFEFSFPPGAPTLGTLTYSYNESNSVWDVVIPWSAAKDNGSAITSYSYDVKTPINVVYQGWSVIPDSAPGGGNESSYTLSFPGESTGTYSFKLRATNDKGDGAESSEKSVTINAIAPLAVQSLFGDKSFDGSGRVDLSWAPPRFNGGSEITGHEYRYKKDSGTYPETWTEIPNSAYGESHASSYTVTGLSGGTYDFQVRAVNSAGAGEPESVTGITFASAPGAPTLGTLTYSYNELSSTWDIVISWSAADDNGAAITSHSYAMKGPSDANYSDGIAISDSEEGGANESSFTLPVSGSNAAPNLGTYSFKVYATNSEGSGAESSEKSVTINAIAPLAVQSLSGTEVADTPGSLKLSWGAPRFNGGSAITGHEYRYKTASGTYPATWNEIADSAVGEDNEFSYTVAGLSAGSYDFQVRAVNSIGASEPGSATGIEVATVPGAPVMSSLTPSFNSTTNKWDVAMAWSAANNNGATIFSHEYRWRASNDAWTDSWSEISNSGEGATHELSYTHLGLNVGTYFFQVRAVNNEGKGSPSVESSVTINPREPLPVTAFSVSIYGNSSVTLSLDSSRIQWGKCYHSSRVSKKRSWRWGLSLELGADSQ